LAIALAVASATADLPLTHRLVALGEVGLSGEIRRVPAIERRLQEAARLGVRKALVPLGCGIELADTQVVEVANLNAALDAAGLPTPTRASQEDSPTLLGGVPTGRPALALV
jgi:DNA repair protein RadA/Sms